MSLQGEVGLQPHHLPANEDVAKHLICKGVVMLRWIRFPIHPTVL